VREYASVMLNKRSISAISAIIRYIFLKPAVAVGRSVRPWRVRAKYSSGGLTALNLPSSISFS